MNEELLKLSSWMQEENIAVSFLTSTENIFTWATFTVTLMNGC